MRWFIQSAGVGQWVGFGLYLRAADIPNCWYLLLEKGGVPTRERYTETFRTHGRYTASDLNYQLTWSLMVVACGGAKAFTMKIYNHNDVFLIGF